MNIQIQLPSCIHVYIYIYIHTKYVHMCTYEGLGISSMSFPILDGLFVYMHKWEGLELLLSGRMVWQPLHCYYSGRIAIGGPVEDFSPL